MYRTHVNCEKKGVRRGKSGESQQTENVPRKKNSRTRVKKKSEKQKNHTISPLLAITRELS